MASLVNFRFRPQSARREQVSPIGLEFADEQVNLVQLVSAEPPVIRAHASLPYPVERAELLKSTGALKSFLEQAMSLGPFVGRNVVTALPADVVRILSVTYQTKVGESDDEAIAKLLQERIGEDLTQFVVDYVPVRTEAREGERLAMVLLSERSIVIAHLEQLRKAGLSVDALEVSAVAIKRWVSTMIAAGEMPQNILVINTGENKTYLTMVSGKRLLFDQEIEFGERPVLERIAKALDSPVELAREIVFRYGVHPECRDNLGLSDIEDTADFNMVLTIVRPELANLVAEIRRAVVFASFETRGIGIGHAFLTGALSRWPGADALLGSLSDMPVDIPLPLPMAGNAKSETAAARHPELVVPAGLALRGFATDA